MLAGTERAAGVAGASVAFAATAVCAGTGAAGVGVGVARVTWGDGRTVGGVLRGAGDGAADANGDGDGDADVDGAAEGSFEDAVVARGDTRENGVRAGRAMGPSVGVAIGVGSAAIAGGADCGAFPRPKKCASAPPSSRPAKITTITSGTKGSPPRDSSSVRRRRRRSLRSAPLRNTPHEALGKAVAKRRRQRCNEIGTLLDEDRGRFLNQIGARARI